MTALREFQQPTGRRDNRVGPASQGRRLGGLCGALALAALTLPGTVALADGDASWQGKWVSAAAENIGSGFATRAFELSQSDWTLAFTVYSDAAEAQPFFRIDITGHYIVGGPSAKVQGARDAVFQYTTRRVTPLSQAAVAMFAQAGCTTQLRMAADATLAGCGFVPSVINSAVEYDLVSLDGDKLRLGDRSGDLSRERPAKLSDFPLVRQK